jgi:hypothetical protein
MFSLKVKWVASSDNAQVFESIKVQDELQANRWLDAIAKYGVILETSLEPVM